MSSDTQNIPVQYPFGHGLSYTRFEVSDASVKKAGNGWKVSAILTNVGEVAGAEVLQLYISDLAASVARPVKELKGFEKVYLRPGESQPVKFTISRQDLSFFDADAHEWVAEQGDFEALLGTSSADIRARLPFKL